MRSLLLSLIAICVSSGCSNGIGFGAPVVAEPNDYYAYIELLKQSKPSAVSFWTMHAQICPETSSTVRESEFWFDLETEELKLITVDNSRFTGRVRHGAILESSSGNVGQLRFWGEGDREILHICVTPEGFSFGGFSARGNYVFSNDKLYSELVMLLRNSGLKELSRIVSQMHRLQSAAPN